MLHPDAAYNLLRFAFSRNWIISSLIHLFIIGCNIYLFVTGLHNWTWTGITIAALFIYWIGNFYHRKWLRTLNAAGAANKHYDDVCEGCDPPCYTDGRALWPIHIWYAASRHVSREQALDLLLFDDPDHPDQAEPATTESRAAYAAKVAPIKEEYARYLKHPKFLRP